ncbi:MAG: dihydrofolate reductase family protein [Anaerolineales bacterium]
MRKIIVNMNLTLDGVMQAPGRPDEDTRGGFKHGGWAAPYFDPFMAEHAAAGIAQAPALLFGRRTYEDFYAVWPDQSDSMFSEVLNKTRKYVASTTLIEPLPWENSTLLQGDVPQAVARLKDTLDRDIAILGSGALVRSLMQHNLVDEYVLSIHPLVLGSGQRLFTKGSPLAVLELVDSKTSTTGVVIATYRTKPAPAVNVG